MTRKRYVKLLMAAGYSRNEANQMAEWAREHGLSYRRAYRFTKLSLPSALKAFADALESWLNAIETATSGMKKWFETVGRVGMKKEEDNG